MTSQLRHRTPQPPASSSSRMNDNEYPKNSVGLVAPSMTKASPQQCGYVMKLHVPVIYSILPQYIQKFICRIPLLSFLAPRWERRYLIQLGSFLYKFKNDTDPSQGPKGGPVPVDAIDVHIIGSEMEVDNLYIPMDSLPTGFKSCFLVSSSRKEYHYATASREESLMWVNGLREARQEAITRSMGHAPEGSYPKAWEYYDSLGRNLMLSKERIRSRMEAKNLSEMEMSNIGAGGPIPRGYMG